MDPPTVFRVYTKEGCPSCHRAMDLLRAVGAPHAEVPCASFADVPLQLPKGAPRTFPQVVAVSGDGEERRLGGFEALRDAVDEPLLRANALRFTLFPLTHPHIFEFSRKALASFWTPQEVSLAQDRDDWANKLTEDDRFFVKHVLAFFAGSDGIVMENLAANFAREVQLPEARQFYASQMMMEAVHSWQYSLLIDALADPAEAARLFGAIETMEPVRKKAAWAMKWTDPSRRFAERLVAFVCVEGILFSGSFCAIYWLKRRGVMPGLCLSNEFISRDEALHYAFGCALYKELRHPLEDAVVRRIVLEAAQTELDFVVEAIPCRLVGMNADSMRQYIKFVADRALADLGCAREYGVDNPFPWMELIGLQGKSNFFERMPSEYQRAGVMGDQQFATDGDF